MSTVEDYTELFKKGSIVEVSSEDEGLRGSWYTATVLRSISPSTHKILVEYHNLISSDHHPQTPLREFVDAILVRPIPPVDSSSRKYRVMEDVDAYHNDGWWEGVVTQVMSQEEDGETRYAVFFRCSREQIVFGTPDLRLHREWVRRDVWVTPLELALSLRRKRKIEETNGTCSVETNGVMENGEERQVAKRSCKVSVQQVGIEKNGNSRKAKTGNLSGKMDSAKRKKQGKGVKIVSNGTSKNLGVKRNGSLKEPRRRASNHTGSRQSKRC